MCWAYGRAHCRVLVPFKHPNGGKYAGQSASSRKAHMGVILCVLGTEGQGLPTSRCSWGMTPPSFFLAASFLPRMSGAYLYHVLMVCEALQCCVFWPSHGTWMGDTHWPSCRHAISSSLRAAPMHGRAVQCCNKATFGCVSHSFIHWSSCARGLISRSEYSQ
jgi:hypothetical protein